MSLVNALDNLEVSPDELSYLLAERDVNILEKDAQKMKAKDVEKDGQKEETRDIKDFKNKEFVEKFFTGNTFNHCTFNFKY